MGEKMITLGGRVVYITRPYGKQRAYVVYEERWVAYQKERQAEPYNVNYLEHLMDCSKLRPYSRELWERIAPLCQQVDELSTEVEVIQKRIHDIRHQIEERVNGYTTEDGARHARAEGIPSWNFPEGGAEKGGRR